MDMILILIIIFLFSLFIIERKKANSGYSSTKSNELETNNINRYPYKAVRSLMTKNEMNFYLVLSMAISDQSYYICPKVRMADIIQVNTKENYQSHFNKIKSKHIDYLICDKLTFKPVFAIELDDSSHNLDSRISRDDFVNLAFYNSGIKLVRFKSSYSYKVTEIVDKLNL